MVLPPLSDEGESYAGRFAYSARREVRRLMRSSPRLADLAIVFPGAMYTLATRRGSQEMRDAAMTLIEDGAPLKSVARTLGLALWLRRLPPEAFQKAVASVPSSENFTRRIATRLPAVPSHSALWLDSVAFAAKACNEDFALWLADQPIFSEPGKPEQMFGVLAAYAWHSRAPHTRAHSLIVVPWRPEIAFDTALCAAKSWLNRMRLTLQLGPGVLTDPWLSGGQVRGYTFVPLLDRTEILAEARAMQNCADQYAERLADDRCRLFSIRREREHVATLEIGPHSREAGMLAITQLKGRHNMAAPLDVWQAAYAWLAAQSGLRRLPPRIPPERKLDEDAWRQLIAPYRKTADGAPWLPQNATQAVFDSLNAEMADLARRGGVSSWLFT
ncbi:MAG: hypothetical protein ACK4TP_07070 [Hyphomicrobium sp.]